MHKSDFIGHYKTLTTADLLDILANKKDYQGPAIEAAQEELISRNLTEIELGEAKQQLLEKNLAKEKQKLKIIDAEIKIKNAVNKLADNVNPIQKEKPTSDKIIKTIAIVYGGFFLLQFFGNSKIILATIQDIRRDPVSSILSLMTFVLIPLASIPFFMKKSFGWVLLAGLINYLSIDVFRSLVKSINYNSGSSGGLNSLFPRPSMISFLVPLAIFVGTLYFLCKADIKEEFKINKNRMLSTLVISGLLTVLLFIEASNYSR